MAEAIVEPRTTVRYFCHRCSIEFEDVLQLQEYTCPYCAGGFIEQLDGLAGGLGMGGGAFSDADMSNIVDMTHLDDSDEMHQMSRPVLNDLAFLMSGGRLRNFNRMGNGGVNGGGGGGTGGGARAGAGAGAGQGGAGAGQGGAEGARRRTTLMDELVWMIGGARPGTGAVTAGAPFVFVGAPGDYVFGGEGLDAVVTQLLGQLENAGPPPMPRERLAALPDEPVSEECAAANMSCSVCWDNFVLGETVCRLECEHIFHSACIRPWLQLHATCPICRRSLLPDPPAPGAASASASVSCSASSGASASSSASSVPAAAATNTATNTTNTANTTAASDSPAAAIRTSIAAALPRILLRRIVHHPGYRAAPRDSSGSSASSSRSAGRAGAASSAGSTPSAASVVSDIERHYNLDLDMD